MTLGDNTDIILFFVQFNYYLETLLVFCVIRFFQCWLGHILGIYPQMFSFGICGGGLIQV